MSETGLQKVLDDFDDELKTIREEDVVSAIKYLELPSSFSWNAEMTAFQFVERPGADDKYFQPELETVNKKGEKVTIPDLNDVTPKTIQYWKERAEDAKHPVLKLRYADLVWSLSPSVLDQTYPEMARVAINSVIEISEKECHRDQQSIIKKLKRALSLSLAINDGELKDDVKSSMLQYEEKIARDNEAGTWGFCFNQLIRNSKITIEENIEKKIISDLEERLDRLTPPFEKDLGFNRGAQKVAVLLAVYYEHRGNRGDLNRVFAQLIDLLEAAKKEADPLTASMWGEDIHSLLHQYGLSEKADEVAKTLKALNEKSKSKFKEISHEMKITDEEMEQFVEGLLEDDIEDSLFKVAAHFIPSKSQVAEQVKDLSQKAPLSYIVSRKLQDSRGRHVATLKPIKEGLKDQIVNQMSQNITIDGIFLHNVLREAIEKFDISSSTLVNFLCNSPIFREEKREALNQGLSAFLREDYICTVHILMPQIEAGIRELVELTGENVLYPNEYGGFNVNILGSILESSRALPFSFGEAGEDMVLYLKMLLTDPRGLNLRNKVCHGLGNTANLCNYQVADRIVHVLLCLSLIRFEEKAESKN